MAETIRTFIAIELNDQIKQIIRRFQDHLKPLGCDISWVKPENAHLTLKFLGDVKVKLIPSVTEALEGLSRDLRSFEMTLTQPGVFPDFRHPRVVWIGLDNPGGKLGQLAEAVETALGNIGFKKERRDFQTHITVGRVRTLKNVTQLCEGLRQFAVPSGSRQSVSRIVLFKSTLTSQGSIYEPLSQIELG